MSGISDGDGLMVCSVITERSSDGSSWNNISSATSSSYVLGDGDVGQEVRVQVAYTDLQGTREYVSSAASSAVANVNDAPTGGIVVEGTLSEGEELFANASSLGDADGLGSLSYRWERSADGQSWSEISDSDAASYTLKQLDVGHLLRVEASYVDLHGTSESVISSSTSLITNVNDGPEGSVVVTGTAVEDGTLSADVSGISDGDGLDGVFSYQWQRLDGSVGTTSHQRRHRVMCLVTVMLASRLGSGCLH